MMRLARLIVAAIDLAGVDGLRLTSQSAVYALSRALVREADDDTGLTRTAMMVLRDLVWRVDTARALLAQRASPPERREFDELFDTSDVHAFLVQAARDTREDEKSRAETIGRG